MKSANTIRTLLLSLLLVASAAFSATAENAIIVYKLTESSRGANYFTVASLGERDGKGGLERTSEKATGYLILDTETGNFRQVFYFKEKREDMEGRRFTVKLMRSSSGDHVPAVFFETNPGESKNYLVFSPFGTGNGLNYEHFSNSQDTDSETNLETLAGKVKTQKLKNGDIRQECEAPSTIKGAVADEAYYSDSDDNSDDHYSSSGKKTLRLDKKRTQELLEIDDATLDDAQDSVEDYLFSKGYEFDVMTMR